MVLPALHLRLQIGPLPLRGLQLRLELQDPASALQGPQDEVVGPVGGRRVVRVRGERPEKISRGEVVAR